jgi:NADPH-dependent 2,4-dienoyl-CoA reductase/sulfur reductase-like enzyme/rhodanese-related sulfurtransferase
MSASTRRRRLSEDAEIIVLEKSGNVSFANCGLPYYVGEVIPRRSDLLLQTPQSLAARFRLDVRVHTEAIAIDPQAHIVTARTPDGHEETLRYDALVLATGAQPLRPAMPGIERAVSLRNVEDVDAIASAAAGARTAVVVGAGFIGLEMAENLVRRGLNVALVEATSQAMPPMDPEMVAPIHDRIRANGVDLRLNTAVIAIGERDVTLADGSRLDADLVVLAIGVRPDSRLAQTAGVALTDRGAVIVDERMRTSVPDIYAVGDLVAKTDAIDASQTLVPLAQTANLQGRMVADAIMGRPVINRPVLGTSIVGVFGLQVGSTGWSEKRARAAGRDVRVIHTHPANHAGYYPGAATMHLKLVVDARTDAILGVQGVGEAGIDKRIDVIATAITGGIPAAELAELELAYAPQFGSAKDPINMLGFIDANLRDGLVDAIQWHELPAAVAAGATVLDVRNPAEHAARAIPGSVLIPLDELRDRLNEVPSGDLVVHCAAGQRSYLAARILAQHGWSVRSLDGGITTWADGQSVAAPQPESVGQ